MRRKWPMHVFWMILSILGLCAASCAQDTEQDLKKEIEALKQGQQMIRKELQEIKALIRASQPTRPTAPDVRNVEFDLGENPVLGTNTASLTLVEFTDYQWPYCGRYVRETFPQITKQYVDTGKIRYALLDMPLPMHKLAFKAAEASHCAAEQGKFWEMHDSMMADQKTLDDLQSHAESISLDIAQFNTCLETEKYADAVRENMALAAKLGINGTPSFVLALTNPEDPSKVKGLVLLRGAQPFPNFKQAIDQALADAQK